MSILFVSIVFPPKFDSEGLQVAKYFRYFREECRNGGMPVDVVTSAVPTLFMPVDESLREADSGYRQKVSIRLFENKYLNFLGRKIAPQWIDRPDSKHSFFRQWKKVVKALKEKPSVIYSRSFPTSSAVMAMKLKRYYHVPWVLHLSDPWTDSPVNRMRGRVREINEQYERECFREADKIALTSWPTIDFYREKYPEYADKFEFYPNVYDPEDIPEKTGPPRGPKCRVVYSGGMAGNRSPEPFLKAIVSLPEEVKSKMEFVFSGIADRVNAALFDRYKDPCINYMGSMATYKDAVRLQQSANVLLLIDFPIAEKKLRVYFLSKLLDYMIARKYIVGTSGEGSACHQVIDGKLGQCFSEEDTAGIRDHFVWVLREFEKDPSLLERDAIDPQYDARLNAGRLYRLLSGLARRS